MPIDPTQLVESYKFWDVASLWARELLEHESLVAKALAAGVIRDGLRFQSKDPKWLKAGGELRGDPYVGYSADTRGKPVVLKAEVLEHLLSVVRTGVDVNRDIVWEEFVNKRDFHDWLVASGQQLPGFWFTEVERSAATAP